MAIIILPSLCYLLGFLARRDSFCAHISPSRMHTLFFVCSRHQERSALFTVSLFHAFLPRREISGAESTPYQAVPGASSQLSAALAPFLPQLTFTFLPLPFRSHCRSAVRAKTLSVNLI